MRLREIFLACHMRIDSGMIGLGHRIAGVIIIGLLLRLAADDMADRIDADLPADGCCALIDVCVMPPSVLDVGERREQEFAMLRGEIAPRPAESGIHRFANGTKNDRILINSTDSTFEKFELSDDLTKRDSIKFQVERRVYDMAQNQAKDLILNKTFSLEDIDLQQVFTNAIETNLQKTAENLIE